jgi:hypothetical protein
MSVPRRPALHHRLDEVGQPVGPHLSRVETLVLGIMAEEIVVVLAVAQADHGEIRIAALRHRLHRDQRNIAMAPVAQNPLKGGENLVLGALQRLQEPAELLARISAMPQSLLPYQWSRRLRLK